MDKSAQLQTIPDTAEPAVDYGRLRNDLKEMLTERYRAGDRIPSERSLAADFKVSPTTISRALNDLSQAGVVRRARGSGTYLCEAAPRQGGIFDPLPRESFPVEFSGRTIGIIGGIGDPPSWSGEPEVIGHRISSAIEREIQAYGGRTRTIDVKRHPEGSERALIADMLREGANGLILINSSELAGRWMPPMLEANRSGGAGTPTVLVLVNDRCEWPVDCVRIDDSWGAFEATNHLLRQGHRRLGFISPPKDFYSFADARAAAFSRAIDIWNSASGDTAASGTLIHASEKYYPKQTDPDWSALGRALGDEFVRMTRGLSGIVAANDQMALSFLSTLEEAGVKVPKDVSVIGYDNVVDAVGAGLSTLDIPAEQLGIQAAKLCRQRLEDPARDMRIEVALRPILLIRSSVQSL